MKMTLKKGIIILGIIILPLLYSLIYLMGFWDPYGNLEDVPVAIVNLDNCENDCQSTKLIDKLTETGSFKFTLTDKETAEDSLINKDYYAVITIPEDFTESFASASTKDRKTATLTYSPNQKTNYLVSQIISTAMTTVQNKLNSEVTTEVVTTLTNKLNEVPEQTNQINNALTSLSDGTNTLNNSAIAIKQGANTLNTSYKAFDGGINELNNGINLMAQKHPDLDNGINEIYDNVHNTLLPNVNTTLNDLTNGITILQNGSSTITNTLTENNYSENINNFFTQTNEVYSALTTICNNNPGIIDNQICLIAETYTMKNEMGISNLDSLNILTNSLTQGVNNLNSGINAIYNNLGQTQNLNYYLNILDNSLLELKNGSTEIYNGLKELQNGSQTITNSSNQINEGLQTIDTSLAALSDGTNTLNDSALEAQTELTDKISETENSLTDLEGLDTYAANPVKIEEDAYGNVTEYGTFFAPYFMSLSLWVGGILILMGLYYDPDKRFKILGRNSENRPKRLLYYNIIGVVQAIILATILKLCIGFEVTNIFLYYGSCILISLTFLAIIQFLFFNFQDVGKFIAIVFLILQLASCGGTFPIETEPTLYQVIYNFMPMTYSVDLLRESLVSINPDFIIKDVLILVIILLVFTTLTIITGLYKSKKELKNKVKANVNI